MSECKSVRFMGGPNDGRSHMLPDETHKFIVKVPTIIHDSPGYGSIDYVYVRELVGGIDAFVYKPDIDEGKVEVVTDG